MFLNMALSIDLIVTLRRPFQNAEKRYPYYLMVSLTLPLASCLTRMALFETDGHFYGLLQSCWYFIEIFIALISLTYATWFLCKPGTGRATLKIIIYRHVAYIIVNNLCQTYAVGSMVLLGFGDVNQNKSHSFWMPFAYLFFGQGILLTLVRLTESSFSRSIWLFLKSYLAHDCCRRKNSHRESVESLEIRDNESDLNSFMKANRQTYKIESINRNNWQTIYSMSQNAALRSERSDSNLNFLL